MVMEINEEQFEEKIKGERVLMDCFAPWCGPCKMIAPVIEELSNEIKDVEFYKLNVDDADEISEKYGIMSIPTIMYFENGELKNRTVGFQTKEELKKLINN